ncbi:hypothetical protein Csa_006928 [Cucumis sativus]|uniref:Uncharacterized protein n=1 Tax=Cucumis sativus TaxID=3659 RepID=A0A0A0LZD0_CUCSA|nr:hypothetical protein Csa_006928 [Cucumis sativus]
MSSTTAFSPHLQVKISSKIHFNFHTPHFLPSTCPLRSDLFISSLPQIKP